jgi:hypothetical protein
VTECAVVDATVVQLKSLVISLIRPHHTSWTDLLSADQYVEWISLTKMCSNWIFSWIFSTQVSPHAMGLKSWWCYCTGANLTSYLVSSSVQFGLKSLFAKLSRLQIKAFSLHPDCWTFRYNCHRLPLFVYIHNNSCIHTFVYN